MRKTLLTEILGVIFYLGLGILTHLLFHGPIDWVDGWSYVIIAFWPATWLYYLAIVVLVGLACYAGITYIFNLYEKINK